MVGDASACVASYRAVAVAVAVPTFPRVPDHTARQLLESIYRAAVDAIRPERAVRAALDDARPTADAPIHLLALGKAARSMLAATLAWCDGRGHRVAGGTCISHERDMFVLPERFVTTHGDHPYPHDASAAAANALGSYVTSRITPGDAVVVLLSGGTSALIGAPVSGLTADAYRASCDALLRSGLDIHAHNAIRRQLSTWGNGRLGAALHAAGAQVTVLAISDVPGDAPASIGSAPCIVTPAHREVDDVLLARAVLTDTERALLRRSIEVAYASTPSDFAPIPHHIVSSNRLAREAVREASSACGLPAVLVLDTLHGDAHACGALIARQLISNVASASGDTLYCWGGEPVVSLPADAPPGGRMQALALAAARELHTASAGARITILAAGTDGRDGATAAAGAVVSGKTWLAVQAAGGDPAALLAAHDSHAALQLVDALIPAFASGTNVNDLVIALVEPLH